VFVLEGPDDDPNSALETSNRIAGGRWLRRSRGGRGDARFARALEKRLQQAWIGDPSQLSVARL
jgi:hypothetical protein